MEERLQKIIAARGDVSRRGAEELIVQGLVKVNGKIAKLGDKADPERDTITVRGARVASGVDKVYIMLNKPQGIVSATEDKNDVSVIDILPSDMKRVGLFPVGRLDKDSEGLLFMTNEAVEQHYL